MTGNAETALGRTGPFQKNLAGGEAAATVTHEDPPRVVGRLDTYRSRNRHWHGQVRVDQCPNCGHPHLHRAPMARVANVRKNAPCGAIYIVVLRPEKEAA